MFSNLKDEDKVYRNLIGGDWIIADDSKLIEIKSPVDGRLVGKVSAMNTAEVDKAVRIAKKAQLEWRAVPLSEKAEILHRAASILENNIEEISWIIMREVGKDKKSAMSEVERTADFIRFTADAAKNLVGESLPGESFPGYKRGKISIVKREPVGVVLAISPFNYPLNLAASKIAPALMAGNSVVFKPATQGSITGIHLTKVFEEAGIPNGVINSITGKGSEIGDHIITHPEIDFINFTGSTQVGQRISKLVSMVPLLMELGGKDAAIVLEDADLELVANNIVSGAFAYSGQRCTAVKRILAVEKVADKLVDILKKKIEKLKIGNPLEENVDIVPLIDEKSADFVEDIIRDARNKGATLIIGGTREGNTIYPTLFDNVTEDMRLAWEEPFGPVLPIIRVKDKDDAIKIANESEYGLQSSVFTRNINDAFYVADKLEVGTVQINNKTERGPDHFPFLGVKASGFGTQGIKYSIEAMSRPKAIVINTANK
ncbi:NADP-dependent glyceraldehyde-3-phosphate dehydrogenase [uncultured Clostridium sp.]|uniref:NADP-dependent glyceraldehyde-3-phosphate dehydrogenase n=1 Tax=uncultured Clostridium sp. TaxID=59620 RepID=UPI0025CE5525|nr:NADP-dependent glyceraldehyde-3-phosphate dehydrogenase [uncultured Clostridium sp.]